MEDITADQLHQMFRDKDWDGLTQILGRFGSDCDENGTGEGKEDKEHKEDEEYNDGGLKNLLTSPVTLGTFVDFNLLEFSAFCGAPVEIVLKIIDIGGKDLIITNKDSAGSYSYKSVHTVTYFEKTKQAVVLSKLFEIAGSDFAFEQNKFGRNPLHYVCSIEDSSVEVVSKLIDIGGRDLLFETDTHGRNPLHCTCENYASVEVVSKLIDIGGRDLLFEKDGLGRNPLISVFISEEPPIEVILKLIEIGGRDLVMHQNKYGENVLHYISTNLNGYGESIQLSNDLLNILTRQGGAEILSQKENTGKTPLQYLITDQHVHDCRLENMGLDSITINNASLLIDKGIQLQFGGEYGIGGLFSFRPNQEIQREIYQNWEIIVLPALEEVMSLTHNQHLPILQAVIINKAPPRIIKSTIQKFVESSINTRDGVGQLPIDVAVRHRLSWNDGTKELVEALLSTQESAEVFKMCIKNGLQWHHGMNVVVKDVGIDDIERKDEETGLYPFMLAGVGHGKRSYDLGSIFHLIKRSPRLVWRYNENDMEEGEGDNQFSRKRQRR